MDWTAGQKDLYLHGWLLCFQDCISKKSIPAVRPAVHVQYNHCRSRKTIRGHIPMLIFSRLHPTFSTGCNCHAHFCDSKQGREDRASLLLPDRSRRKLVPYHRLLRFKTSFCRAWIAPEEVGPAGPIFTRDHFWRDRTRLTSVQLGH